MGDRRHVVALPLLLLAMECLNQSKTPVLFLQVIAVHVLMTILLIASTTSLIMVGVELFKADQAHRDTVKANLTTKTMYSLVSPWYVI